MTDRKNGAGVRGRLHDEILDGLDEERELELDDDRLAQLIEEHQRSPAGSVDRTHYFRELLRLCTRASRWWCCSRAATPPARAA